MFRNAWLLSVAGLALAWAGYAGTTAISQDNPVAPAAQIPPKQVPVAPVKVEPVATVPSTPPVPGKLLPTVTQKIVPLGVPVSVDAGSAPEVPPAPDAEQVPPAPAPGEPAAPAEVPAHPDPAAVDPVAEPQTEAVIPKSDGSVMLASIREVVPQENEAPGLEPKDYLWQPPKQAPEVGEPLDGEVPLGLEPLAGYTPRGNPITKSKFELGRQLYFDPRLSLDTSISCATCHNPEQGWTDQSPTSTGIYSQVGGRNAPTVLNTAYGKTMFWDGRSPSLEAQSQGPPMNPIEMGNESFQQIVERFRQIPAYQEQFLKVFGTDVTLDGISKAIAAFERAAALSGNSKYDQYQMGEYDAMNESEKRGMVLFGIRPQFDDEFQADGVELQKGKCTLCHVGFNFTDEKFHNLGVGYDTATGTLKDLGRWAVTPIGSKDPADLGAFKTPTCRDLVNTAPYMHDGSEKTLEDVIELYDRGGNANPYLDEDMKPLKLTPQEKEDLIAFLKALTGEPRPVEVPTLPPGPDGKAPDARAALHAKVPGTAALSPDSAHEGIFLPTLRVTP